MRGQRKAASRQSTRSAARLAYLRSFAGEDLKAAAAEATGVAAALCVEAGLDDDTALLSLDAALKLHREAGAEAPQDGEVH